jgi:hypothetical protein
LIFGDQAITNVAPAAAALSLLVVGGGCGGGTTFTISTTNTTSPTHRFLKTLFWRVFCKMIHNLELTFSKTPL